MTTSTYTDVTTEARDFITLLKPRVMFLVVFTGIAGMVLAPGHVNIVLALIATLCIALASGGAGAVNMWFDRDIDAIMTRTRERPIPMGRIEPEAALAFGSMAIFAAVSTMGLALNWTAAALLAGAAGFYIFIYTMWLKRRTPQNIVIGGAAGAFPPVIGWAAVTGHADWQPWLLFLLVFLWTPPHFWALALYKRDDYARANVPMLPVVRGERHTKWQMLLYTLLLIPGRAVALFRAYRRCVLPWRGVGAQRAVSSLRRSGSADRRSQTGQTDVRLFHPVSVPDLCVSDSEPDPHLDMHEAVEYARKRKLRGRNIALFLALLIWVLVIYIGFMVKIHTELHP